MFFVTLDFGAIDQYCFCDVKTTSLNRKMKEILAATARGVTLDKSGTVGKWPSARRRE